MPSKEIRIFFATLFSIVLAAILTYGSAALAADAKSTQPSPASISKPPVKFIAIGKMVLPAPPHKAGCFRHGPGGWTEIPCLSYEKRSHFIRPTVFQLAEKGTSPVVPDLTSKVNASVGELDVNIVKFGSETDSDIGNNQFSLQLNTDVFKGNNGDADWVQFVYQQIASEDNPLCIWNIDTTTNTYNNDGCISINVARNPQNGDAASIVAFQGDGLLNLGAILPWAQGSDGDAYAVVAVDQYDLEAANNIGVASSIRTWNAVNGGFLGSGNRSTANLTQSCITTTLRLTFDPLFDLGDSTPILSNGSGGNTGENNNIVQVASTAGLLPVSKDSYGNPIFIYEAVFDGASADWQKNQTCYPVAKPGSSTPLTATTPVAPFEDDTTQFKINGVDVHICKDGALLIGVDIANNRFLCTSVFQPPSKTGLIADTSPNPTQGAYIYSNAEHEVHICPAGMAMVGWSQNKDLLVCGPVPEAYYVQTTGYGAAHVDGPGGTQVSEPNHSGQTMHSCDPGNKGPWAMIGLQANDNVLICMNSSVAPEPPK